MYAIIQSGGRQVKVTPGETVTVDRVAAAAGETVALTDVLFVARDGGEVVAGTPFVNGAKVLAVVDAETRGPRIRVFMKKRRKGSRRTVGHRSTFTRLRITEIVV